MTRPVTAAQLEPILVDSWTVKSVKASRTIGIYTDAVFTMSVSEDRTQVTAMPFTNGEELQRLISALQSAAAYPGKRA
jgi:hypothetical protein